MKGVQLRRKLFTFLYLAPVLMILCFAIIGGTFYMISELNSVYFRGQTTMSSVVIYEHDTRGLKKGRTSSRIMFHDGNEEIDVEFDYFYLSEEPTYTIIERGQSFVVIRDEHIVFYYSYETQTMYHNLFAEPTLPAEAIKQILEEEGYPQDAIEKALERHGRFR